MDKGYIFYIMGKSSSGKDTLYGELLNKTKLSVYTMYTTRPMRPGEKEGREYHFVDEDGFKGLDADGKVIEHRTYMTVNGPWTYFTVDDGSFDSVSNILMIGTLESYASMRAYFGSERLKPIYIECDDGVRLQRALDREKQSKNPDYKEMCRRFIADSEDFSEEKIKAAGIEHRFINLDFAKCRDNIIRYIDSMVIKSGG